MLVRCNSKKVGSEQLCVKRPRIQGRSKGERDFFRNKESQRFGVSDSCETKKVASHTSLRRRGWAGRIPIFYRFFAHFLLYFHNTFIAYKIELIHSLVFYCLFVIG
mgnify:FL=1